MLQIGPVGGSSGLAGVQTRDYRRTMGYRPSSDEVGKLALWPGCYHQLCWAQEVHRKWVTRPAGAGDSVTSGGKCWGRRHGVRVKTEEKQEE